MTDLIIGCFTNYNWDQIKYWSTSIDKSGFTGDKAMIVYNSSFETVQKLLDNKFSVIAFNKDERNQKFSLWMEEHIVVRRFYDLWQFLNNLPTHKNYNRIITTDVKDVIFQTNPSSWLDDNLNDKQLVISSESLCYKDEPWGNNNMLQSFPLVYNSMKDKIIWNCGVIAGTTQIVKDLCLNIYLISKGSKLHNPDQAALNIIMNLEPFKSITKFANSEDGWVCQAGTTVDPSKIDNFRPHLLEPEPTWIGNLACTSKGTPFAILHQWDRVPAWSNSIQTAYKDQK